MGHLHLHQRDADLAVPLVFGDVGDRDVGDLPGRGGPVRFLRVDQRETLVEVEVVDDERLTLMDVHRARVGGGRGPPGVDGPEEPAGLAVDDRDLGADAAPDVERTVRIGFGRDEPSVCTTSDQALRREFGQDFGGAEVRHLGVGQRQLQCRAQQLRSEHVRVRGSVTVASTGRSSSADG